MDHSAAPRDVSYRTVHRSQRQHERGYSSSLGTATDRMEGQRLPVRVERSGGGCGVRYATSMRMAPPAMHHVFPRSHLAGTLRQHLLPPGARFRLLSDTGNTQVGGARGELALGHEGRLLLVDEALVEHPLVHEVRVRHATLHAAIH